MSHTVISKTRYTFVVLHRTDQKPDTLEEALDEANTGHAVGDVIEEFTTDVPDDEVPLELKRMGSSDGEFFANDIEEG